MSDRIIHEYDGIQEADNELPRWWLWILYGSIVFAGVYWLAYQALRAAPSPVEAYQKEKLEVARVEAERLKAEGEFTPAKLVAMSQNAAIVQDGRALFVATCVSCRGPNGGGLVGPNLTDAYWLHGGSPTAILTSVRKGWLDKGMPAWGPQLGEDRVRAVAAYVLAIRNTNVPGGKPAQGQKE